MAHALIIGGGIAGAAVAAHLARAGREVVLIERKAAAHDKVCGEFISGEARLYLRQLDIEPQALGAVSISAVNLYAGHTVVTADLPFPALSVSRRLLDEAILTTASAHGAELRRGRAVQSLRPLGGGWVAELDDGSRISATDVFLATGKHDLRGWKRPAGQQNDLIAFKLHWRVTAGQIAALESCVELFLFPGGYAGLSLIESGVANLCLVVRRHHFAKLNNRWDLLLSSLRAAFLPLHQTLADAEACSERPLAIASIPYGFVQRRSDGPWRLGDQAAVIPSFSGDGISIALHSARLASEYYLTGKTNCEFQSTLARDIAAQVRTATLLSRMLVHAKGQTIAMVVARSAPTLVGNIANRTRIPSRRLITTKQEGKAHTNMHRALTA
ncbi:MAG TPA: FAD-dependent oxidoreductase [Xanthobacteraceae bacterium]|jgi:flavin-dependent dehydrogenase